MIDDTIRSLEKRLESANVPPEKKKELLSLLGNLKKEIDALPENQADRARAITGFADLSAHEATRDETNPRILEVSLDGLQASVDDFEASHPQMVQIVNSLSNMLSNIGI